MATWKSENSVLTDIGVEILNKLNMGTGDSITITRIVAGSGRVSESRLHSQTNLSGKQVVMTPLDKKLLDGGSEISFYIDNSEVEITEEFTLQQIGIFVSHPDYATEQLYLISQCDEEGADTIPLKEDTPLRLDYSLFLSHSNSSEIVLNVDPTGMVTKQDFEAYKEEVNGQFSEVSESVSTLKTDVQTKPGFISSVEVFDPNDSELHEGFEEEDYVISSEIHNDYINNEAEVKGAFVTGRNNKALSPYSNMSGTHNISEGYIAHVEGARNLALGGICHVEGRKTTASGEVSHIEGESFNKIRDIIPDFSKSTPIADIIEAWDTDTTKFSLAYGNYSHVEGKDCLAFGEGSHAGGQFSIAKANYSFAHGHRVLASGLFSSAMGNATTASNTGAFVIGYGSVASGLYSLATGFETKASANYASSFGYRAEASGDISFAIGFGSKAVGKGCFAGGLSCEATAEYSFAFGGSSKAKAAYSFALGNGSSTSAISSFASGTNSSANKEASHALGYYTYTGWEVGQMAVGRFNQTLAKALFLVGNGENASNRNNAFVVFRDGTATLQAQGEGENAVVIKKTLDSKTYSASDITYDGSEQFIGGANVKEALDEASFQILRISSDASVALSAANGAKAAASEAQETASSAGNNARQALSETAALYNTLNDHHKIRTYTSLGALNITAGEETIVSIVNALPLNSKLVYAPTTGSADIYPTQYCLVEVTKTDTTRVEFICSNKVDGKMWIGHYSSSNSEATRWSGWKRVITADETPEMLLNTEYALQEKYKGNRVYSKVLSIGTVAAEGTTSVAHGINNFGELVSATGSCYVATIPTDLLTHSGGIKIEGNKVSVTASVTSVATLSDVFVVLKYTKTA